ncbi:MAG: Hsp20/alpha crystallin family protein [Thaumarchaeota archaeon]|nr:Hsp20/alpha crystallin family protein [Nitrososphaerota archaeon]
MDDLESFMEETEEEIEHVIKGLYEGGQHAISKPLVYGFSIRFNSNGVPVIKSFGDKPLKEGFREPFSDQLVDQQRGDLKIILEMPGIEKNDIDIKSTENETTVSAGREELKYRTNVQHHAPVLPDTATATYLNGILEITFRLKDKANKGYTKIKVE